MFELLKDTITYVLQTLLHNAPVLLLGIAVAALIKVYIDPEKLKKTLMNKAGVSIFGSVAFGTFTPFCACGTMAVILSMLTTALPWGPIMAFLTSSPLMSPDEFILYSGIMGVKFAVALTAASVILGIASGYLTHVLEKKTGFMKGQARFLELQQLSDLSETEASADKFVQSCCGGNVQSEVCCSCCQEPVEALRESKLEEFTRVFVEIGLKKVLVYFSVFAAIGFMINRFVPAEWIKASLGSDNLFAVPLLALIGLPLYVNGASALPIMNTLLNAGASGGALLAFMITGPGTSAGVIAGLLTIMRKKAIALYVAYILIGGILLGYLYDLLLQLGL